MSGKKNDLGEVMIYRTRDSKTALDVRLHEETVWLNQYQLAKLFGRERSVLTKHIRNIFTEGELKPKAVCAKFAQTGPDGKTYQVDHYNLDLIISVGYRVKSREGVRFRQWATQTLKNHLVRLIPASNPKQRICCILSSRTIRSATATSASGRCCLWIS